MPLQRILALHEFVRRRALSPAIPASLTISADYAAKGALQRFKIHHFGCVIFILLTWKPRYLWPRDYFA